MPIVRFAAGAGSIMSNVVLEELATGSITLARPEPVTLATLERTAELPFDSPAPIVFDADTEASGPKGVFDLSRLRRALTGGERDDLCALFA